MNLISNATLTNRLSINLDGYLFASDVLVAGLVRWREGSGDHEYEIGLGADGDTLWHGVGAQNCRASGATTWQLY